jgi:hypothetical protein
MRSLSSLSRLSGVADNSRSTKIKAISFYKIYLMFVLLVDRLVYLLTVFNKSNSLPRMTLYYRYYSSISPLAAV